MRKIITAIALSMSITGCASTGGGPVGSGPDLATIVAEIRANTQFICRFVPTSDSALRVLISTFTTTVPGVSVGWAIADAICNSVKAGTVAMASTDPADAFASAAKPRAVKAAPPNVVSVVVNGVIIKGTIIKGTVK